MVKKRTSNDVNQVAQNDNGNGQANSPEKNAPHYWNSKTLAFEWWELAPDGFCPSSVSKHLRNPKP
jgi:hypothetical protein